MADGIIMSGGSSTDLDEANAIASDVLIGKKFFSYSSDDVQTGTNDGKQSLVTAITGKGVSASTSNTFTELKNIIHDNLYKQAVVRSGNFTDTSLNSTTKTKSISFGTTYSSIPTVLVASTAYWEQIQCYAINVTTTGFTFQYVVSGGIYNNVTFTWLSTTPKEV